MAFKRNTNHVDFILMLAALNNGELTNWWVDNVHFRFNAFLLGTATPSHCGHLQLPKICAEVTPSTSFLHSWAGYLWPTWTCIELAIMHLPARKVWRVSKLFAINSNIFPWCGRRKYPINATENLKSESVWFALSNGALQWNMFLTHKLTDFNNYQSAVGRSLNEALIALKSCRPPPHDSTNCCLCMVKLWQLSQHMSNKNCNIHVNVTSRSLYVLTTRWFAMISSQGMTRDDKRQANSKSLSNINQTEWKRKTSTINSLPSKLY